MRSKSWCCKLSLSVIRKDLLRFWPVWASYLAVWCLLLVIPLLNLMSHAGQDYAARVSDIHELIVDAGALPALIVTLLYGGIASFAVWSYLCQGRSASLYHSLPLTRESLFLSHFTAGLSFLLLPNALAALLAWLCQLALGYASPVLLLTWLAVVSLESLLFFSLGTLAAMLTGSLPAVPVLYGLLGFSVAACEALMNSYACALYYGVSSLELRLRFLSPFVELLDYTSGVGRPRLLSGSASAVTLQFFRDGYLHALCLYGLAALLLALAALLLYRRRATESAGDVIALPRLRTAAKYLFSFGCSLTLGWVFLAVLFPGGFTALPLFLCTLLAGAIGYLASAMLLKKSFRVLSPRLVLGFLPLALVLGGWTLSIHLDLLCVEGRVPAAEDIVSVQVNSEYNADLSDPEDLALVLALHRAALTPEAPAQGENQLHFRLEYTLTDGEALERSYQIPYSAARAADPTQPAGLLKALMSQPEHILQGKLPEAHAVFDSIELDLYTYTELLAPDRSFSGGTYPIDPQDGAVLTAALREDVLAGRACGWDPTWDSREVLLRLSFGYKLPETGSQWHWKSITIWLDESPTATLEALVSLGYLTEVPHD